MFLCTTKSFKLSERRENPTLMGRVRREEDTYMSTYVVPLSHRTQLTEVLISTEVLDRESSRNPGLAAITILTLYSPGP